MFFKRPWEVCDLESLSRLSRLRLSQLIRRSAGALKKWRNHNELQRVFVFFAIRILSFKMFVRGFLFSMVILSFKMFVRDFLFSIYYDF